MSTTVCLVKHDKCNTSRLFWGIQTTESKTDKKNKIVLMSLFLLATFVATLILSVRW